MSRDALIVGISSYLNLPSLAAPASDAEEMYQLLLQYGGFDSIKPLPLIYAAEGDGFAVGRTSRLSHDELKNALVELFMPQGDRHPEMALFYFSGHGQRHADGIREGYLAVSDSQTSGGNMGISLDWLRRLLAASPVRKQVILLDCCYSGELLSLDEADPGDRGKGHDRCFIAASREYQLAYEQGSGQHGVLTAALLKALDPHPYDSGWVNNHSLAARIREQWQSGIQSPLCTNSGEQIIITRSVAAAVSRQPEKSVLPEQIQEKVSPASMTPMLAPSSGSDDSLETRAETVYGELKPEDQDIAQRLFLTLVQLNEGSEAVCCQANRDSLLTAGMNDESVNRVIKAFGDAGLIATDNGPENGEAVIKMAQESLISCWPRLRGWLDEHQENIIFHRRLDAAARHWQEKKWAGKRLWHSSDLKQLKKFAEKHQQDMDDVQQAFFAANKNNETAFLCIRVMFLAFFLGGGIVAASDYFHYKMDLRNKQHRILAQIHRNAKAAKESADQREIHNLSFDVLQRAGNLALQLLPHDEDSKSISINMIREINHESLINTNKHQEDKKNNKQVNGKKIISPSDIEVWWPDRTFVIINATFNSLGNRVVTLSNGGEVKIWSSANGDMVASLNDKGYDMDMLIKYAIYGYGFTEDGGIIFMLNSDGILRGFNIYSGKEIEKQMKHGEDLNGAILAENINAVLTYGSDGTVQRWDIFSGKMTKKIICHEKPIKGAICNKHHDKILTYSEDGTVKIWDINSGVMIGEAMRHKGEVDGAMLNKDETSILTWSEDNTARMWNFTSGAGIGELMRHEKINGATFSSDGTRILTWGDDRTARLWNAASGAMMIEKPIWHSSSSAPIFSDDGTKFLTWSDSAARCWSADSGTIIGEPMLHDKYVHGAIFNKDGSRVLTWSEDGTAKLWNTEFGTMIGEPMQNNSNVDGAIFNKDESRILTWSGDGIATLWNAASGTKIGELMRNTGESYRNRVGIPYISTVSGALFNKDESRILTWNCGRTATLWNIEIDYDFPKEYLPLFVEVATETTFDNSGNVRSLKSSELKERRKEYIRINEDHLKTCKYKHVNFYLQHQKPAWNIP